MHALLLLCGWMVLIAAAPMNPAENLGEAQNKQRAEDRIMSRSKRQFLDLAGNHNFSNGTARPVGDIHGNLNMNGFYKNPNNYHVQPSVGLGSVIYRSPNSQHSVGVGAYSSQGFGNGVNKPTWGAGIGYKFKW
ncbi:unnamed protein product [Meganyctiphanes norvegica]|uniref:Attacin C-terminal domain-containing protein n=1 Tax=Meganyctiphanes norvegica TaxID=48144 RepID=A0AAV2SIZ3_MEGNR